MKKSYLDIFEKVHASLSVDRFHEFRHQADYPESVRNSCIRGSIYISG